MAYKFNFDSNMFMRALKARGVDLLSIVHSPSPGIFGWEELMMKLL